MAKQVIDNSSKITGSGKKLYPVSLDITGKRCLVIGGGTVAARKIRALLLCGGVVQIVSPEVCGEIRSLAEADKLKWLPRPYHSTDMIGVFLVFAATDDPEAQALIAHDAAMHHVLLNRADNSELSDFHVPAKIRRGDLVIAISTGGGSPALASLIKRRLTPEFGEEYATLVELMSRLRPLVVKGPGNSDENRVLFQAILELPVLESIAAKDWHQLKALLGRIVPPSIDCEALVDQLCCDLEQPSK